MTEPLKVPIEIVEEFFEPPVYAHDTDAGCDLLSAENTVVFPGETVTIRTGIKVAIPEGYVGYVVPRSGISINTGLRVIQGTIDSGYRGEIRVIVENSAFPSTPVTSHTYNVNGEYRGVRDRRFPFPPDYSEKHGRYYRSDGNPGGFVICRGDRIAQLVLHKVERAAFEPTDDISQFESDRQDNGFGSTGVKS